MLGCMSGNIGTIRNNYRITHLKKILFLLFWVCLILALGFIVITTGPLDITIRETFQVLFHKIFPGTRPAPPEHIIRTVWLLRVPRYLSAILVGFTLAVAGAIMQPVLRNPLASPFTLGISAGAGFGASLVLILDAGIFSGRYSIVLNAFIFAAVSALIIRPDFKEKEYLTRNHDFNRNSNFLFFYFLHNPASGLCRAMGSNGSCVLAGRQPRKRHLGESILYVSRNCCLCPLPDLQILGLEYYRHRR